MVADEVDDPQRSGDDRESADAHTDRLRDATAPERALRARRLFRSAIAYLGLDPASFGAVDDARGADADSDGPGSLAPEIGPRLPRVQRVVAFLGIDVDAVDGVTVPEPNELPIVPSPTAPTRNPLVEDDNVDEADNTAEPEIAPVDPIAVAQSPTDAEELPVVAVSDATTRHYWRRTDDDILYRPSRRPRSPRRAWRDRITSRG